MRNHGAGGSIDKGGEKELARKRGRKALAVRATSRGRKRGRKRVARKIAARGLVI